MIRNIVPLVALLLLGACESPGVCDDIAVGERYRCFAVHLQSGLFEAVGESTSLDRLDIDVQVSAPDGTQAHNQFGSAKTDALNLPFDVPVVVPYAAALGNDVLTKIVITGFFNGARTGIIAFQPLQESITGQVAVSVPMEAAANPDNACMNDQLDSDPFMQESDVDCGGPGVGDTEVEWMTGASWYDDLCARCGPGKQCTTDEDCRSNACNKGKCG